MYVKEVEYCFVNIQKWYLYSYVKSTARWAYNWTPLGLHAVARTEKDYYLCFFISNVICAFFGECLGIFTGILETL